MTRKEFIGVYNVGYRDGKIEDYCPNDYDDIFDIEQEPKIGHWVEENINEWSRKVFCSECGYPPPFEHISNGDVYSASGYGVSNKTKFCPNCGAKMESEVKE